VVRHVEEQDYQIFEKGRHISIGESFGQALAFLGKTLLLNVMALPIYLFFPVLNFAVALLLNSYLLGREMFEIVAYRRLDQKTAMALRKKNRGLVLWTGMLVFLMGFVPILNLFIPILAVIAMTHCVVVCENKQAI
jgi:CysZ protein